MNQVEDRLSGLDNKGEELDQINKECGGKYSRDRKHLGNVEHHENSKPLKYSHKWERYILTYWTKQNLQQDHGEISWN